jgi:hypothetical protein
MLKRLCIVAAAIALGACGTDKPTDEQVADAIGRACDMTHSCNAGTKCGTVDFAYHQCIAPCMMTGQDTCPDGTYCSINGVSMDHVCLRLCQSAMDCTSVNDTLTCTNAINDDSSPGPLVCQTP